MTTMHKERLVKKPRKTYRCETCGSDITGEHIYIAQVWEGDFHTRREHVECIAYRKAELCKYCHGCEGLTNECFTERICRDCEKYYDDDKECNVTVYECIKEKLKGKGGATTSKREKHHV